MIYGRNPMSVQLDRTSLAERYQQVIAEKGGHPLSDDALRAVSLDFTTETVTSVLRNGQDAQFGGPSDAQARSQKN